MFKDPHLIRTIGWDLDGVLADYITWWSEIMELEGFGVPIQRKFNLGFTQEEFNPIHDRLVMDRQMFRKFQPYHGAVQTTHTLARLGLRQLAITRRQSCTGHEGIERVVRCDTNWWLAQIGFPATSPTVFCKGSKLQACVEAGVDVFVEDDLGNCREVDGKLNCEGRLIQAVLVVQDLSEADVFHRTVFCPSEVLPHLTSPSR